MIEIMISRKNRLEPTLILQSVNDVTNCKRNKTEKHFFSVFIKYTHLTLIQPRLNPGIKKKFVGSGIKFCNNFGIRDQNFRLKCGISRQKIYLVTTLLSLRAYRRRDQDSEVMVVSLLKCRSLSKLSL